MSSRTILKLIFCVAVLGLLCSFKAPLADMQYRLRYCRIDSIKSVNDWYFIYASDGDTIYKIISNKNYVMPEQKNNVDVKVQNSLKIGNCYELSLCPTSEYKRTASGVLFEPMGWHGIEHLDSITTVEREIERGILKLYYCENINGIQLNNILEQRAAMSGRSGLFNGIYCDSSKNEIFEIRDSIVDFYVKDSVTMKSNSDFQYQLTAICNANQLFGNRYMLYPDSLAVFSGPTVIYLPRHYKPGRVHVSYNASYKMPYSITLVFPIVKDGVVQVETEEIIPDKHNASFVFPDDATVFSFMLSTCIDGITYTFAYPDVIDIKSRAIELDLTLINRYLIENSHDKKSEAIITYDYIEHDGCRYNRYR